MGTLILLVGECTPRECSIRAGVGLITRRVAFSAHTQSTLYCEDGLITVGGCCKTIRTSTGRCAGDRKRRKGRAAYKGGGDVIGDHPPLGSVGEPGKCHGASDLRIRGPRGSPIRRGRESHIQLAGGGGAVRYRVEVECHHQVGAAVRGGPVNSQAGDEVIHPAANRIKRDARHR
jgi:hypothetical protein